MQDPLMSFADEGKEKLSALLYHCEDCGYNFIFTTKENLEFPEQLWVYSKDFKKSRRIMNEECDSHRETGIEIKI